MEAGGRPTEGGHGRSPGRPPPRAAGGREGPRKTSNREGRRNEGRRKEEGGRSREEGGRKEGRRGRRKEKVSRFPLRRHMFFRPYRLISFPGSEVLSCIYEADVFHLDFFMREGLRGAAPSLPVPRSPPEMGPRHPLAGGSALASGGRPRWPPGATALDLKGGGAACGRPYGHVSLTVTSPLRSRPGAGCGCRAAASGLRRPRPPPRPPRPPRPRPSARPPAGPR